MILLIDNYDSFSYNLYQMIGELGPDLKVIRNDEYDISEILEMKPEKIILSPGPGRPEDAGIIVELVQAAGKQIPVLGVCLGHQALCQAYGADIVHARSLMHGKQSSIQLDPSCPLFQNLPEKTMAARYHSLAARPESLPPCLKVTARSEDGEIMAVMHQNYPQFGLQFHPESIMTPLGKEMLQAFLELEPV